MPREGVQTASSRAFRDMGSCEHAEETRFESAIVLSATWSQHKGSERLIIFSAARCDQHSLREVSCRTFLSVLRKAQGRRCTKEFNMIMRRCDKESRVMPLALAPKSTGASRRCTLTPLLYYTAQDRRKYSSTMICKNKSNSSLSLKFENFFKKGLYRLPSMSKSSDPRPKCRYRQATPPKLQRLPSKLHLNLHNDGAQTKKKARKHTTVGIRCWSPT